jgi:cysteine desulfurase/selenocysteine lyase
MQAVCETETKKTQNEVALFDVDRIREDFPILKQQVHGRPLIYLDSAATSQKPQAVIDATSRFYEEQNSNVHRGVHYLSQLATREYEDARVKLQRFINAAESHEIIYTRGTTESINLVAYSYGRKFVHEGDEIIISAMEHHSNIVPWQLLCEQTGARLRVIPINDAGELLIDQFAEMLNSRVKMVAVTHVSNALGTINPVKRIIEMAHSRDIPVLVDGAQAAPHMKVDVRDLDCDFYAFSGHKMCGPTGIGALYGKSYWLEAMPPFMGGGDMIASVSFEKTTYNVLPYKFEAGTPNISGGVGLGVAVDYLNNIGLDRIAAYEDELLKYATEVISAIPGVKVFGAAREKASVLSFTLDGIHPHDIGTILDDQGIAIRAGHHCAQPLMKRFNVPATARASFAFYNTRQEIDALAEGLQNVIEVLS